MRVNAYGPLVAKLSFFRRCPDAHARSANPLFRARAHETVGWLAREMTIPAGAFSASLDADSEGEEGKFYVWSLDEIRDVLGPDDAARFAQVYDITPQGNFEGHSILNRLNELPRSTARGRSTVARKKGLRRSTSASSTRSRAEEYSPGLSSPIGFS